jgi:pimeloyl-ACP methyl ester carboxylesterase
MLGIRKILFVSISILIILNATNSFSQPYDIGYRFLKFTDFSRTTNSVNKELGKKDSLYSYRTIAASIWHPALISDADKKTTFGDFIESTELDDKNDFNKSDSVIQLAYKFADYYDLNNAKIESLKVLLTNSYKNPKFHPNKFPLVIYIPGLNGFSFENHLLCEAIAKLGYVVVSFNSKGTESRWVEPLNKDFETLIRDIQFVMGELSKTEWTENNKVILIGHSIGGWANILTKMRDNRIKALVSLDGSIKHDLDRSKAFIYNDFNKVNCPFLSISDQNIDQAKNYLDSMPNSDRYYYQFSEFEHNSYKSISYMLQDKFDSLTFDKYQNIIDLVAVFVENLDDVNLNEKLIGLNSMYFKGERVNYSYLKSVPDIDKFKEIAGSSDFTDLNIIYRKLKNENQGFALSEYELVSWGNGLKYYGYKREAIEIYKLITELYPNNESIKNKLKKMTK